MALRLPSMDQGYGGTPKGNATGATRNGAAAAKPASISSKVTPLSPTALQAPATIFPQYFSNPWAGLPTGMLGTMPQQPAPATPPPATPAPSTGGGGVLGNPQMNQFIQRYPGLAQYFQSRSNSPLSGLFGGLFGRRA